MSNEMQLTIVEMKKPVLNVNVAEVKAHLAALLEDYKGIVVTEESLDVCKDVQKKLTKLSKEIDDRRKEVKKEFTQPIIDFEAECKEILALIDNVNDPIKEGIKVFDDKRREAKKEQILDLIDEIGQDLNDKFFNMLVVDEKYLNVTTTMKSIKADLTEKVEHLKKMQANESLALELIKQQIKSINELLELVTPLSENDFEHLFKGEIDIQTAISVIQQTGKSRKLAETNASASNSKPESEVETVSTTTAAPSFEVKGDEVKSWVSVDIYGTEAQIKSVFEFMNVNKITFEEIEE